MAWGGYGELGIFLAPLFCTISTVQASIASNDWINVLVLGGGAGLHLCF